MPKIGAIPLRGKDNKIENFDLYYSRSDGFYLKGFPQDVFNAVKAADNLNNTGGFSTEQAVTDFYQSVLDRYFKIVSTERKVIFIRLSASSEFTMNKVGPGSFHGFQQWFEPYSSKINHGIEYNSLDYSFGFEYETGVIITGKTDKFFAMEHNDKGEVILKSPHGSDLKSRREECVEVPYTWETELFLRKTAEAMQLMVTKFCSVFADEKKLLTAVANNTKLLNSK